MREPVLVAAAAALIAERLEMPAGWFFDLVGRMTVGTDGTPLVALDQQLPVHALVIDLFDADVTLSAGPRDVGVVRARTFVDVALDVMHPVAVVAGRRHNQTHLQKRPAVDAVPILDGGVSVSDAVFVGQTRIVMARRARVRQIQFKHWRVDLLDRHDVVVPMATDAGRRARSAHGVAHSMNAGGILPGFLFVTATAINRRRLRLVRKAGAVVIVVAVGAVQGLVDRFGEARPVHEQGNGAPLPFHGECWIAVALAAGSRRGGRRGRLRRRQAQRHHQPHHAHTPWPAQHPGKVAPVGWGGNNGSGPHGRRAV